MVPVGRVLIGGALSGITEEHQSAASQYLEMHSNLWEKIQVEHPEFAATCDLVVPIQFNPTQP